MLDNFQPEFTGLYTFLGFEYTKDIKDADAVFYGMPFDLGVTNRPGCKFGPNAIRKFSSCKNYHEELDFNILDNFKAVDYGNFDMPISYIEKSMEKVITELSGILENTNAVTIGVGGDHTLAFPELSALKKKYGKVAIVHFDSHTDTWAGEYFSGQTAIHHGTPFRLALEQECIDGAHSIQVGMRGGLNSVHDHDYAFSNGFEIISANELTDIGMEAAADRIRGKVGDAPVFVTFDIDFLDPAFAPGTGTPVIGGFTTAEALKLLRLSLTGLNIVGMDLVEVAPEYDPAEITCVAARDILREFTAILSYNKNILKVKKSGK